MKSKQNQSSEADSRLVFAIGTKVIVGDEIPAVITAIEIRAGNYVAYECSWWDNLVRECELLHESEVKLSTGSSMRIGFING